MADPQQLSRLNAHADGDLDGIMCDPCKKLCIYLSSDGQPLHLIGISNDERQHMHSVCDSFFPELSHISSGLGVTRTLTIQRKGRSSSKATNKQKNQSRSAGSDHLRNTYGKQDLTTSSSSTSAAVAEVESTCTASAVKVVHELKDDDVGGSSIDSQGDGGGGTCNAKKDIQVHLKRKFVPGDNESAVAPSKISKLAESSSSSSSTLASSSSSSTEKTWICSACTFMNPTKLHAPTCACCGASNVDNAVGNNIAI